MKWKKCYLEKEVSTFQHEPNSKVCLYFWQLQVQTEVNIDTEIEDKGDM